MTTTRVRRPRRGAARWLAAACVVALVCLVGGCTADAGGDDHPEKRAFTLHGPTLTVDSENSAVEVVPVDGRQVRVTRWFKGRVVLGGSPSASWQWHDDRLTLRMKCSGMVADCSARYRVEVPRDAAVHIRNEDGSVSARGIGTALKVVTANGSVRAEDCSGPLDMQSEDGSVAAGGITGHQVHAVTKNGSIKLGLRRVPDEVTTRSEDGSTEITLPRSGADGSPIAYKVTVTTTDGGKEIDVPRDDHSPHQVSAHSQNGKVTLRSAN
ncbi:DUF4097 family beta strand repeat-containing protein [Streptomyces sp. TS71-3]|uniref:DUF4097 family beta strand repeat-containing protein n=1 Tax=Streptomyces sp. TS71-3 TaxID=2733862 RepID=UPI001B2311BA|nr:DUF4097 family beta strand repeat-containing protein [Streptomyces sp. TS71-3]GHJ37924.1 lipoprotein [Streptomyces sp. TS71-3]